MNKRVGPFEMVSKDEILDFGAQGKFRIVLYGAYNAMGLIGSECNGIAVLDENRREVVTDEICREDSGYFGPTKLQLDMFELFRIMPFIAFKNLVNQSPRRRYDLS